MTPVVMRTTRIFSRTALVLGWLLLALVAASYMRDPDACGASDALWASLWFFAPPLLGFVGAVFSQRRDRLALVGGAGLLVAWLPALGLWMLEAIVAGACQGG